MFESARRALALLLTRFRPPASPPEDPYVSVREPRRRGPGGRSAAVAVREPDPDKGSDLTPPLPSRRV